MIGCKPIRRTRDSFASFTYLWTCFGFAGALLAAKLNVIWHDPWCTPRLTPYNFLFAEVAAITFGPLLLLAIVGICALVSSVALRPRWDVWLALSLVILAIYSVVPLFPFFPF